MPILGFFLIFGLYLAIEIIVLEKMFSSLNRSHLIVTLGLASFVAYGGVVLNGILPPLPLGPNDMWTFLFMFYVGMTAFHTIGLGFALDRNSYGFISNLVVSAGLNLVLCAVLGIPFFYVTLSASNFLFK